MTGSFAPFAKASARTGSLDIVMRFMMHELLTVIRKG
jgi:hypothetical protein